MKSSSYWMPTSHRLLPSVGSWPSAMNPLWPSMLMSSTLARDNSSVLRSRPIGLPRYQVKEKCGPRIPPPCSHWQPIELRAVLTSPVTRVCSVMPPHSGNIGPCDAFCDGPGDCGTLGEFDPLESPEHAANSGIMAAAA